MPPSAALPQTSQTGVVEVRYWDNLPGNKIAAMTGLAAYPDNPTSVGELTELQGPQDRAENYGALVRGFIVPKTTGQYQFFAAGDDVVQFWLSTSQKAADAEMIALVPSYTDPTDYAKYSSQTSGLINLTAGQRYYFEIRFKEGIIADHYNIAWEGPGISRQVIGSNFIASFAESSIPATETNADTYSLGYRVGFLDGSEKLAFNPAYPPLDSDNDGIYDNWEVVNGLDPKNAADAKSDPDKDLLSASDEFRVGTTENKADTDGDGLPDGVEFAYNLNPLDPADAALDLDNDGYSNLVEYQSGTDFADASSVPAGQTEGPAYVQGFTVQYFEGTSFNRLVSVKNESNINYDWGQSQPSSDLPADKFSIRWTGVFTAPHTGGTHTYKFTARADDGVRLYLDGNLAINQWKQQSATSYSQSITLAAGATIPVTLEYYEDGGDAAIQLSISDTTSGQAVATATTIATPDPKDASLTDTDNDGIPDSWELLHGLNPWAADASGISNSQGVTNLQAYEGGMDPFTLESTSAPGGTTPGTTEPPVSNAVTLSWTAPLTREDGSSLALSDIDSYHIVYGQSPDNLNQSVDVGGAETSIDIGDLASGTWYFSIRVVDVNGNQSALSSPVQYQSK